MSTGYTKLFAAILDSTVWREPDHVRIMWVTMLAMADQDGIVNAAIPGLADRARVTIEQCEEALECFRAPDPYSRSKEEEGRRIRDVDGGWFVINHKKYRDLLCAERQRELTRRRVAKHREKKRNGNGSNGDVTPGNECNDKQKQKQKQDQDPTDPLSDKQSDGAGQLVLSNKLGHDPVRETWEHFCRERKAAHPGCRKLTLTNTRRAHIRARLKSHGPGEIEHAVRNYFDPRFFWAQNGHTSPELVFRSAEQLEKVRDARPRDRESDKPAAPAPAYHKPFVPPTSLSELTQDIGNGGLPPSRGRWA
jgi:hypothetical protein